MATDATGIATSLGIPTMDPDADAPSGLGFNAAMATINTLLGATSGHEYAYNEFTSTVDVIATTEAAANTIVTAAAVAFDGATPVWVEFFTPRIDTNAQDVAFVLYDGSSSIGLFGDSGNSDVNNKYGSAALARRLTPPVGAHAYSVRAYLATGVGTAVVRGGVGGVGTFVPGFIVIRKV